jgi:hypothetical protein
MKQKMGGIPVKDITEEHYAKAAQNGISRKNVRQRFWDCGWEIEKAITEPIKTNSSIWPEWKEVCKSNGISNELFNGRLKKGMPPEQAATKPVSKRKERLNGELER